MTLRPALIALAVIAAAPAIACAQAGDITQNYRDSVGLPMHPQDAAGAPWTLSSGGRTICAVRFGTARADDGVYPARIGRDCGQVLPTGIAGWKPVTDGLALVGADSNTLIDFNQTTPHDLVAGRGGGPSLELTRP